MKFGYNSESVVVPSWRECYLNVPHLKLHINFVLQMTSISKKCDHLKLEIQERNEHQTSFLNNNINRNMLWEIKDVSKQINYQLKQTNKQFFFVYKTQMETLQLFYQFKVLSMGDKYQIAKILSKAVNQNNIDAFLNYTEYLYIEVIYLEEMRQTNVEIQKKILKKYKKVTNKLELQRPNSERMRIKRMEYQAKSLMDHVEELYVENYLEIYDQDAEETEPREQLRKFAEDKSVKFKEFFICGFWVGVSLTTVIIMIFILLYNNLALEQSAQFAKDFPVFRGVAFLICYLWMLGFNIHTFEKYKINHQLIFKFDDHHYTTSTYIFKISGIFTAIFSIVFLGYMMIISKIIPVKREFQYQYLALIIWCSLGAYIFMPLPIFNYQGRFFTLKMIAKVLISPITGVDFPIIWTTLQLTSAATPLRDIAYTICYYTKADFTSLKTKTECQSIGKFQITLLPITLVFVLCILLAIRNGISQGKYFCTIHFWNSLKFVLVISVVVVSYFYETGDKKLLAGWIVLASCSTIVLYIWDLKVDWQLFQGTPRHPILRKQLLLSPKKLYYFFIVINFILRLSWMLTISPRIVQIFGNQNILIFVTGLIQIGRRGIWNLLKVQCQHLKECQDFKALPSTKKLKDKIIKIFQKQNQEESKKINKEINEIEELEEERGQTFTNLLKEKIQNEEQLERSYQRDYEKKIQVIKECEEKIKDIETTLKTYKS